MIRQRSGSRVVGTALCVSVLLLLCTSPLLATQDEERQERSHSIAALAFLAVPVEDPLSATYGSHPGFAVRYAFQPNRRWSLAAELASRRSDGSTATFGFPTELRVITMAALARLHFPIPAADIRRGDLSVGVGLIYQRLEETVGFPEGPVEAAENATGLLITAGIRRRLGARWGVLGEARFTRLSAPSPAAGLDGAQLGTFELAAGVHLAF